MSRLDGCVVWRRLGGRAPFHLLMGHSVGPALRTLKVQSEAQGPKWKGGMLGLAARTRHRSAQGGLVCLELRICLHLAPRALALTRLCRPRLCRTLRRPCSSGLRARCDSLSCCWVLLEAWANSRIRCGQSDRGVTQRCSCRALRDRSSTIGLWNASCSPSFPLPCCLSRSSCRWKELV